MNQNLSKLIDIFMEAQVRVTTTGNGWNASIDAKNAASEAHEKAKKAVAAAQLDYFSARQALQLARDECQAAQLVTILAEAPK